MNATVLTLGLFRCLTSWNTSQYYRRHHDYLPGQVHKPQGPRVLTVFLYLNDVVEGGGGTRFTELDITVEPRLGRALIWPSVLDRNPTSHEPLTYHEALPVEGGEKYAANAWARPPACFATFHAILMFR